ncbi:MAG: zinc ribbon domain-containing protein [Anaerolineales bacterium]|nr:MAG: zinc ribbon domain-containing protein [Anaerolineales bacterium]
MPIYEYRCQECGESFDKFVRSMSFSGEVECPHCHSKRCKKSISLFGISSSGGGRGGSLLSCAPSST